MKVVDLIYFSFLFYFYFYLYLFSIFPFLELRVRVSDNITQSHDTWKKVEDSRRSDVIQHVYYMLTSCFIYGTLG